MAATICPDLALAFGADRLLARLATPWVSAQETETSGLFHGVGVVTAINPRAGAVTLNHEEIKGFMAAMIMMYRVQPFSLAAALKPGDKVEFTIDAKSYTIRDIKLVERKK